MVRRTCVCGASLHGLGNRGPLMFGFVPSSSLAHYNYDCEFDTGVTLLGGRVMEQCGSCGALVLCEYPTVDGSMRMEDPLITYGPGTVYEQCEVESVPVTYRSFRALVASGVTGGVMYSDAFKHNIAELFHTDYEHIPSWKVVKDAMRDKANAAFDEWWAASIGRNFIVLYENMKVLRPVAAWRRIPHTEIKNRDIAKANEDNKDPLKSIASDTTEMAMSFDGLVVSDEATRKLNLGNQARLALIEGGMPLARMLMDLPQWAPDDALHEGATLFNDGAIGDVQETRFGIWVCFVADSAIESGRAQVNMLMRHELAAKVTCSCQGARTDHVCRHIVATSLGFAKRFSFQVHLPQMHQDRNHDSMTRDPVLKGADAHSERFGHYADAVSVFHGMDPTEMRYAWLENFIGPLSAADTPLYHVEFVEGGAMVPHKVGYCVYHEVVLNLIDSVINHGDKDYIATLHSYGLEKDVRLDVLNFDSMDERLTLALVTMTVYRERRSEGYIAECLEKGTLLRLIEHLRDLEFRRIEEHAANE